MLLAGVAGPTAKARGKVAAVPTAVKSLVVSYLMLLNTTGCTTITAIGAIISRLPSGAASFTACAAIRPPAPGRFSTITGEPIEAVILSAIKRAVASAEPPGGKPTKIFTGAACAKLGIAIVAVAALSRPRAWRRRINGDMRFS